MNRSYTFSCLILFFACLSSFADTLSSPEQSYYPTQFYRDVEAGTRDLDLRKELFNILSSEHEPIAGSHDAVVDSCPSGAKCYRHRSLGYKGAREILFGRLHLEQTSRGYAIRDVYCQRTVGQDDFSARPPGPGQIPDPTVLNAEHNWPQSRFSARFDRDLQKSDLHILYPVASRANSSRNNNEFGDVVTILTSPCANAERGYTANGGRKVYFEVPDAHKGNVARAIFYFSVRYDLRVSIEEEDSLKAWHRSDPPDAAELARNAAIFDQQGDRNPFIDHPELVNLISDF